jgi:predicted alpha/beta hydrolase
MQPLIIYAQDGYPLAAHFYTAQTQSKPYPILIAPATGIAQGFYRNFAEYLTHLGYNVMSFDFRGIGGSLHGPLHENSASIVDWGHSLLTKTQADQVILIGHSAGGQLLGIMPNFQRIAKLVTVAGSSGHIRGLKGRTQLLAPFMFYGIFPLGNKITGYAPTKMIGMGENLPQQVGRDWAHFCRYAGYVINAQTRLQFNYHQDTVCPITAIFAKDDEIATPTNVNDLLRLYPNAPQTVLTLDPKSYQHHKIGHMLMFKKSHHNLWPVLAAALAI